MANATPDNTLQQQQAAQQAAQMRQAQKQNASHANPTVKFSQVMQTQQAAKSPTTIALLQKKNPVGGAEVVKAAISANGKKNSKVSTATNNVAANAATATTSTGVTGSDSITSATGSDGTSGSSQLLQATARLQELNQDFNLQYLNLQENQQAESRQYTALSNVSKTKSDTAKNSLSNVK